MPDSGQAPLSRGGDFLMLVGPHNVGLSILVFFQYLKADRAHPGAFSHRDASACPAVCPRGNSPLPPAGAAYRCAHRTERTADLRGWAASEWPAWGRFGVGGQRQRQRQTLPVNAAMASLAAASAANVTPPLLRTTDCALRPAWAADGLALGNAATLRAPQYRRIRGPSKMAVRRMVECWPRLNLACRTGFHPRWHWRRIVFRWYAHWWRFAQKPYALRYPCPRTFGPFAYIHRPLALPTADRTRHHRAAISPLPGGDNGIMTNHSGANIAGRGIVAMTGGAL